MYLRARSIEAGFLRGCEGVEHGSLRVRSPAGVVYDFGCAGPRADLRINDWRAVARGALGAVLPAQTYARGLWDTSSIEDLATVGVLNAERLDACAAAGFWSLLRRDTFGPASGGRAAQPAAHAGRALHPAGNEFYMTWLDAGMSYSAALFAPEDRDLERAQDRKNDRILDALSPGASVLDLDCGWGGFAERAANRGHRVTGLTQSRSRKGFADALLDGRAEIRLEDSRETRGSFDGIVAIEIRAFDPRALFATIKRLLTTKGAAIVQTVTVANGAPASGPAPGNAAPISAGLKRAAERAGLAATNHFSFGQHYAETWRAWGNRLNDRQRRLAHLGFGAEFTRHWGFHFGVNAAAFATGRADVIQLRLTHA